MLPSGGARLPLINEDGPGDIKDPKHVLESCVHCLISLGAHPSTCDAQSLRYMQVASGERSTVDLPDDLKDPDCVVC